MKKKRKDLYEAKAPIPAVEENPPKGPMAVKNQCVGILYQKDRDGYVEPDPGYDLRQYGKIWIPNRFLNGAPFGMKVVCEIINPQDTGADYYGKVVEVIGDPMRHDVAILSIMRQFGLRESFPEDVLKEADAIVSELTQEMIQNEIDRGRVDLRSLETITIDGEDAKDLDDAISIEVLPEKRYRLYVHIADVNHYVSDLSELDTEARLRGTSVYLADRVIPMLPPRLSNGICSLNPGTPRFTLTAEMNVNAKGQILSGNIYESIIQSDARTSYLQIQELLDGKKESGEAFLLPMAEKMRELTDILIEKREKRGSLQFSFPETHVSLDEKGEPVDVYAYPIYYSNRMIEEFMILCNEFIANHFFAKKYPFIFRVHEPPDPQKIQAFFEVSERFGVRSDIRGEITPVTISAILENIKEEPFYPPLSQLLLRSLTKAEYRKENLGHFGLASSCYCHFTSPIRRYPDLYIHRIIKAYLGKKRKKTYFSNFVKEISFHSSEMERNAADAQRASVDEKTAEYMSAHVGETFEGIVSGVIRSGLFVRLDNTVEGMVPFFSLDGYYIYDEKKLEAKNRQSGEVFRIGDPVTVQLARVDRQTRNIDFILPGRQKKERLSSLSEKTKRKKQTRGKRKNRKKQR